MDSSLSEQTGFRSRHKSCIECLDTGNCETLAFLVYGLDVQVAAECFVGVEWEQTTVSIPEVFRSEEQVSES